MNYLKKNKIDYSDHIKAVTVVVRKHPDFRVISWMNDNYEKNIKDIADQYAKAIFELASEQDQLDDVLHDLETIQKLIKIL